MAEDIFEAAYRLSLRRRPGFKAFAATIDLLGISAMALSDPREAQQRVNDVQRSGTDAVLFFPGAQHYRACFAGDSWFVVRELDPEEDAGGLWP